jgi:hypothetical protein
MKVAIGWNSVDVVVVVGKWNGTLILCPPTSSWLATRGNTFRLPAGEERDPTVRRKTADSVVNGVSMRRLRRKTATISE